MIPLPFTAFARSARRARSPRSRSLAGCATVDTYVPTLRSFGVYKLDINQGNYLSQDMVDKLRVGQTKAQVRQLLGTPLLVSLFRDNRWDYVYEFTRQGEVREHRTFTVYFVDDKLARWEGDEMPASVAELNREAAASTAGEDAVVASRARGGTDPRHLQASNDRTRCVIAIAGAGGRMGQALIEAVLADSGLRAGRRARRRRAAPRSAATPASASAAPPA